MFTPLVLNLGLSSLIGKGAVLKLLITNILIAKIKILCNVLEVYLTYVKLFDKILHLHLGIFDLSLIHQCSSAVFFILNNMKRCVCGL